MRKKEKTKIYQRFIFEKKKELQFHSGVLRDSCEAQTKIIKIAF